jgi:hypothetical protein
VKKLSDWVHRISKGWVTALALIVFVLFIAFVLPAESRRAGEEGGGAGSPDTSFFYTSVDLYRLAQAYGETGRSAYIRARFTFDLVWPAVYTLFLTTSISWLCRQAFPPDSPWQRTNLAPLLAACLDLLENLSTSLVMARYPARTAVVDVLAPVFTLLKWFSVGGSFLVLLIALGGAMWAWVRRIRG